MIIVLLSASPADRVAQMYRLFSYVIVRDYGFAPNPFGGYCTLATCKPRIRRAAGIGDWVVGTGSKRKNRDGHLVFIMRVSEVLSFNQYWQDIRFLQKRPNLRGSKKQAFGDNIYFKDSSGIWHQKDSHHSYGDGSSNRHNIDHDTQTDRVLIGPDYAYWGSHGPLLPRRFRDYNGEDLYAGHGHKCHFSIHLITDFVAWYRSLSAEGYCGDPGDWDKTA